MSKIKTFLTDSQPGYVLKISVNLSLNVLIRKVLTKKCNKNMFFGFSKPKLSQQMHKIQQTNQNSKQMQAAGTTPSTGKCEQISH